MWCARYSCCSGYCRCLRRALPLVMLLVTLCLLLLPPPSVGLAIVQPSLSVLGRCCHGTVSSGMRPHRDHWQKPTLARDCTARNPSSSDHPRPSPRTQGAIRLCLSLPQAPAASSATPVAGGASVRCPMRTPRACRHSSRPRCMCSPPFRRRRWLRRRD